MLSRRQAHHSVLLAVAIVSTLFGLERRSFADCAGVVNEEVAVLAGRATVVSAQLTENGKVTKLPDHECGVNATCQSVYFQVGAAKPAPLAVPAPPGYAAPRSWSPVAGTASQKTCPGLFEWVFEKNAVTPAAAPPAIAVGLLAAPDLANAHKAFKDWRLSYANSAGAIGTAQMDLTSTATETLQILGQIVVDRASNKAYLLLQDKVEASLDCSDKATRFPATCAAVSSLRLQDLAMAPTVLFNALAKDLVNYVVTSWPGDASKALAAGAFTSAVFPLVAKPGIAQDATIRAIIDALSSYVASQDVTALDAAQGSVVLGVLAYTKCLALGNGAQSSLAKCDVSAIVDQLAGTDHDASKPAARGVAGRLLSIATATNTDKQRVQVAVDTLFDTSCMLELNDPQPALACAQIDTIVDLKKPNLAANDIAFLEAFVDASVATDAGRLVVVASKYVDLALDQDASLLKKRGLRLLGGLLDYGTTFANPASSQDQVTETKVHDQRTQILESLTTDMTDRTGREGDDVFSLGGALRLVGGMRVGTSTSSHAFYGPVSLPLGIAYTHIPKRNNLCGVHVQLDAFDLGNYVAFDDGPTVKTPDLGDSVSPSLSVGAACGTVLPFVIAPTVGYTPKFQIDPAQPDKRGAIDVGLSVGIHVPLFDLN